MNRKNIVKLIMAIVLIVEFSLVPFDSLSVSFVSAQAAAKQEMMFDTSSFPPGYPSDPGDCNIECLMIEVQRQRVENLQNEVREKLDEIKWKQTEQSKLSNLLNKINELQLSFAADSTPKTPILSTAAGLKEDVIRGAADLDESNHHLRSILIKIRMKQDIEQAVAPVQTKLDFYTTEFEQDWIELQALNKKLQEAIEILNNLLKKRGNV